MMYNKQVIFINGPQGSGKDTVASWIQSNVSSVVVQKFAEPLERLFRALFPLSDEEYRYYREQGKEEPAFEGKSLRWWFIYLSETCLKPVGGPQIFGRLALPKTERAVEAGYQVVFSDSGFADEAFPVVEKFGYENCVRIHLSRPGFEFRDSRSYWDIPGLQTVELSNNASSLQGLGCILSNVYYGG